MNARAFGFVRGLVSALLIGAPSLAAQEGLLTGSVTDLETGRLVASAQIRILGGGQEREFTSDTRGMYRAELSPGTYDLVIEALGYEGARIENIGVAASETSLRNLALTSTVLALDEIVVSASRGTPEKSTEAPVTTHVVSAIEIEERPALSFADHLVTSPGVDLIASGLQSSNVVVRGFNNIFSGALHMLTDHRVAGVPSLRVNLMHLIPATDQDVERMEVVLGPGSALYGPNTANGVVHLLTKSPLTSQGTTVTLGGGERSVFQGSFRSAFLIQETLGVKISGEHFRGDEWEYVDPTERAAREATNADGGPCVADRQVRGLSFETARRSCERLGVRDFDLERWGVEARADWRFADDGTLVATYGRTRSTGIEMTGLGAAQTRNWIYDFYQARVSKDRFFAQAYYNRSDIGDSYLILDGTPLVDRSTLFVAQAQQGVALLDGVEDVIIGVDYSATRPQSNGTIYGFYEDDDDINEWGAYLQSKTALSSRLDLVLAGRVDAHSALSHAVWSPRAAVVFRPEEGQSFRLSYNRAFSTPSSLNLFLDVSGGFAPEPLGSAGYSRRAFGTGHHGFSFLNPDGGLAGVRSPFNPAGASQLLPADPAVLWPLAVGVLQARGAIDGEMAALLAGLSPTSAEVGLMLLDLAAGGSIPLPVSEVVVPDVPPLLESYTETFELGWTGLLRERVVVSADAYYMTKRDFVSPLLVQTPLVLLNGQDVGAFLAGPVGTAVATQLIAAGMDPGTAQANAEATVAELATGIAGIPLGVVSSDQVGAQGADLIATFRNAGDVELWGADLSAEAFVTEDWTLTGTYSFVSKDYFRSPDAAPIALNAPKHKGSVGLAYRNLTAGISASGRLRLTSSFPASSVGFVGTKCVDGGIGRATEEACVARSAVVDVAAGYQVPDTRATVQLSISNVFNRAYRSFVGVPSVGRLLMMRLKYDLW